MNWLIITVAAPLVGFLILAVLRDGVLSERMSGIIGTGSVLISALSALCVALQFDASANAGSLFLWQWFSVGNLHANVSFYYDGLALTMVSVITGVGLLIHLFSTWYMKGEEGYARFFSYMNLFVACMLVLVLADNYLLLYFGWEGVGICSYLLIGFYYRDSNNSAAAMKAFIITRIGDVFLAIGLFLIYYQTGTLDIQAANQQMGALFSSGALVVNVIGIMLMLGAFGKSAQLPLQTWLPDAMAGPTPISALIHAATMVTAGVYLIARSYQIFELAPSILYTVAVIGAITLLISGFAALKQHDIKKVLAYSTMSQLGYMFLALGVGAYDQSIRHLMVHSFFKALLFLSAGAVIIAMHHEQDIRKMGGLYKRMPLVYVCFLIGSAALAAFPWLSAGFYSKDDILWHTWASGNTGLFLAGLIGALLTSVYTFRMFYLTFHGKEHGKARAIKGWNYYVPLVVLAALSTFVGALIIPPLAHVLPDTVTASSEEGFEGAIGTLSIIVSLVGLIGGAWWFTRKDRVEDMDSTDSGFFKIFASAFGFDRFYQILFVTPYLWVAKVLHKDYLDYAWVALEVACTKLFAVNKYFQTGKIRDYAMSFSAGLMVLLFVILFIQS